MSAATFAKLANYTLARIMRWARRKHRRITVKTIRRRYCNHGWWQTTPEIGLFNPDTMRATATGEPRSPAGGRPRDEPSRQP